MVWSSGAAQGAARGGLLSTARPDFLLLDSRRNKDTVETKLNYRSLNTNLCFVLRVAVLVQHKVLPEGGVLSTARPDSLLSGPRGKERASPAANSSGKVCPYRSAVNHLSCCVLQSWCSIRCYQKGVTQHSPTFPPALRPKGKVSSYQSTDNYVKVCLPLSAVKHLFCCVVQFWCSTRCYQREVY